MQIKLFVPINQVSEERRCACDSDKATSNFWLRMEFGGVWTFKCMDCAYKGLGFYPVAVRSLRSERSCDKCGRFVRAFQFKEPTGKLTIVCADCVMAFGK